MRYIIAYMSSLIIRASDSDSVVTIQSTMMRNSLCAWSFLLLLLPLLLLIVNSTEGQNSGCSFGEVRLVDGRDKYEGRVEICLNGEWGTVCDRGYSYWAWDDRDATVVCRQLGFINEGSTEFGIAAYFGEGSGLIHRRNIHCTGTELKLNECQYYNSYSCTHSQDAGVLCPTGCERGAIRLSSGDHFVGRVEICLHGVWGRVCGDEWDDIDATVVCRQLGFTLRGTAILLYYPYIGRDPIWMDNVACTGNESHLIRCYNESDHFCYSDAGVICYQASTISQSPLQASPRVTVGPQPQHNAALGIAMGTVCAILSIAVICLVAALVIIIVRTKSVTKQDHNHSDAVNNPVYNESQFRSVAGRDSHNVSHSDGDTGDYSILSTNGQCATVEPYIPGAGKTPHESNMDESDYSHLQHHNVYV